MPEYNAYVTVDVLKSTGALNVTSTAYDSRLLALIEGVSREVDRFTGRYFYYTIGARTFSGNGKAVLPIPDLIAIPGSGIKEDTNADGTYETVWGTSDFILWPYNANPTGTWGDGRPYVRLEVSTRSNGTQDEFLKGQQNYEITGTWGFRKDTRALGLSASGTWGATATSLVLSATASGTIEVGQTLIVDSELMYVTAYTATSMTVRRAVNGSTGTVHSTSTISALVFPSPIAEGVMIQASRLWKRRESAFAQQVGLPESGQFVVWTKGLDPDVRELIDPYRRLTA